VKFRILFGLLLTLALPGADKPPQWLAEVAGRTTPVYKDTVRAAVLFNEERAELQADGRVVTTVRRAVKVLTRSGQREATARVVYRTDTAKVRSLRAWLIYPAGGVKSYDKKETIDVALSENDVYNEARVRAIVATDHAQPGAVFGYEAVSEDRSIFTQFTYEFQDELPALRSRFVLSLPTGWEVSSHTFNHAAVAPDISGSQYLWQLDNLEPIELEPASPSLHSIAPWLAVSYAPPPGTASVTGPVFKDWASVSNWLAELNSRPVAGNESVAAKARELTAASGSELDRIRAIGSYVQGIKYVSIQTGVGRGGGYQPHPAPEVLSKSYGDCKDKANLMRSLLAAAGIEAYPVAIFSGDPHYVRESWASPQQFNHAIVAVRVSPETQVPAVGVHESLGRLLLFDPTDAATPVGYLPSDQQDSLAVIAAPEKGGLMRVPAAPPSASKLERTTQVNLAADGSIEVDLRELCRGQSASDNRALHRRYAAPDYRKVIEHWVTRGAGTAAVSKVLAEDGEDGTFSLHVGFSASAYAQSMRGQLLVFRPAIVSRRDGLVLLEETRRHPVVLDAGSETDTVAVKLPAGFSIEELPAKMEAETPFGTYSAEWEAGDGELIFRRSLETRATAIPAEEYKTVRDFFLTVARAEGTPVVLVRQ